MRLEVSPEDLVKVRRARARNEKTKINSSWLFLAEFGYYFGYEGIKAIKDNDLTMEEADMLLGGARKVWSGQLYDNASATLIATASAHSKKPSATFKKATSALSRMSKADI